MTAEREPTSTQADWARLEWFEAQAEQDPEDAASYFGHVANGYQRYRHRQLLAVLEAHADEIAREAMLDLGCAAGDLTALVGERLGFRTRVGVDFVAAVLDVGRRRFPGIDFRRGSLPQVGFTDESFDLVIASEVLYYLTEPARMQAMAEIRRVLRKGGLLLFTAALGPSYFSPESARALVGSQLDIVDERLLRMKAYHRLTGPFHMATRLGPMLHGDTLPASAEMRARFERWRPLLRLPPLPWAVAGMARLARPLLASERLPALLDGRASGRPTNTIILARRET